MFTIFWPNPQLAGFSGQNFNNEKGYQLIPKDNTSEYFVKHPES